MAKKKQTCEKSKARALERFLEYLITTSAEKATSKEVKTLTPQHFLEVVSADARLNFLKETTLKSCNGAYSNNGASSYHSYE
jgi:hypothetical protein